MQSITVIVPEASVEAENAWMQANIDPAGGLNSFVAPLTSNGSSITHYWFSNQWNDDKAAALLDHYGMSAYADAPEVALIKAGLTRYSEALI